MHGAGKRFGMGRSWTRILAVPVVSAGLLAGAVVAAPAAFAQTDTGGTVAVTVPFSYIQQLARAGVVEFPVPLSELSVDKADQTVTVTFPVTGGDADVNVFFGSVDLGGTVDVAAASGKSATIGGLQLNLETGTIDGTPSGSSTPVSLLDPGGNITFGVSPDGATQTYDASQLTVDPAGAAYLDGALHTGAFSAGQVVGSLAGSWGFSE